MESRQHERGPKRWRSRHRGQGRKEERSRSGSPSFVVEDPRKSSLDPILPCAAVTIVQAPAPDAVNAEVDANANVLCPGLLTGLSSA